jgi:hypothetical protein
MKISISRKKISEEAITIRHHAEEKICRTEDKFEELHSDRVQNKKISKHDHSFQELWSQI